MKKLTSVLLIAFIAIVLSSCKKDSNTNQPTTPDPEACFTLSKTTFEIGESLTISNCSKNNESYQWQVNGLDIPGNADPEYTFDSVGTYTIKLTVISGDGKKTNSITKNVTVTNQFAAYSGTWNITETMTNYPYYTSNYQATITVDNKGNVRLSKYTNERIPVVLSYDKSNHQHNIYGFIINISSGITVNSEVSFQEVSAQKQLSGSINYYETGTSTKYNDVVGVKL